LMRATFVVLCVLVSSWMVVGIELELVNGSFVPPGCTQKIACGGVMASIDSIDAYSNGPDQCSGNACAGSGTYGLKYQCVELAQRYFAEKFGITDDWHDNAIDFCTSYPKGVSKTSNPAHGDLMVFNWAPWGHVAVIDSVTSTTVNVVEQNNSPSGTNAYPRSSEYCFLTASSNSGGPSCGGLPDGWFCGYDGVNGDTNTNYLCSGGQISQSDACSFSCVVVAGANDECSNTGSCSGIPDGWFCGNDQVGADADILYFCSGGQADGAKTCPNGCQINQGSNDSCK